MSTTVFRAVWYDPAKVTTRAKAAGWKEEEGGLLDIYQPDEDPTGHEAQDFQDLKSAETHLRNIVANGHEFWGQGTIREFERAEPRCQYCTCNGWRVVREYPVDQDGIAATYPINDCLDDEE